MSWDEIATALLFAAIPWVAWVTRTLLAARRDEIETLEILRNPEESGIGTNGLGQVIEDNSRAIRELSYYIQWSCKTLIGKGPPPFVEPPGQ